MSKTGGLKVWSERLSRPQGQPLMKQCALGLILSMVAIIGFAAVCWAEPAIPSSDVAKASWFVRVALVVFSVALLAFAAGLVAILRVLQFPIAMKYPKILFVAISLIFALATHLTGAWWVVIVVAKIAATGRTM